jgi:hypothetical protein
VRLGGWRLERGARGGPRRESATGERQGEGQAKDCRAAAAHPEHSPL